jgi:predicted chitinase
MKFTKLGKIKEPTHINNLSEDQLKELQTALNLLGYPAGKIDGLIGPKTRNAWAEFKTDIFAGNPDLIGVGSIEMLKEKVNVIEKKNKHDFSTKAETIKAIKSECVAQSIALDTQIAYVLATTHWETAQTFKPVREAFWLSEQWRKNNLRYYPFYGRGYVQLTWENNYQKYSDILGVDLVGSPDLAMENEIALFVLVHGFKTGTFTGRKITDYINDFDTDFINARRCINGTDRAHEIAELAENYLNDL